ncbi:MAG: MraY family glycosyltransferase, partial [Planctomycetota bacterium]
LAIAGIGLVDDAWVLRGRQKLLLQILVAATMVGAGNQIQVLGFFGWDIPLGLLALPLSVLWLLIAINALNLLDGADGMAGTIGMFVCLGLAMVAGVSRPDPFVAVLPLVVCGGLAGFLLYNRPPASIFLGDAGSMMIGLFVGVMAMWSCQKESVVVAAAPIAILVLPLFDSTAAIIRRWMTGRSLYATDRGHLHHLLHERFGSHGMLMVVAGLCTVSTTAAVVSARYEQQWIAPIGTVIVLLTLVLTRTFGHSELRLLAGRSRQLAHSFLVRPTVVDDATHYRMVQVQGQHQWDMLWEPLVELAKKNCFAAIRVDFNAPWLHEGYHANWQSLRLPDKGYRNKVSMPLFAPLRPGEEKPLPIGRIEGVFAPSDEACEQMNLFMEHAREFQEQLEHSICILDPRLCESQSPKSTAATTESSAAGSGSTTELLGVRPS